MKNTIGLLSRIDPRHLPVIVRIAKHPKKGLRPFFADPRNMISLRLAARRAEGAGGHDGPEH